MRFSRHPVHALQYDTYASVQTAARQWLWSEWQPIDRGILLDLGSGPVACPVPLRSEATVLAVDQSLAMVSRSTGYGARIAAEACALPFASGSIQGIVSSMAMQWVGVEGLAEWSRIIEYRGRMAFVVPISGTLAGLRECLEQAAIAPRILSFSDECTWVAAVRDAGFHIRSVEIRHHTVPYMDRKQLVRALTRIGAAGETKWASRAVRRETLLALEAWCDSGQACLDYVLLHVQGEKQSVTSSPGLIHQSGKHS